MTSEPPRSRAGRRSRALRAADADTPAGPPDDIQDAYLKRAIAELGALNDEIGAHGARRGGASLPVLSSGSPQAEIVLVKYAASHAERQEGVAFFGRSGTAVLKSVQRLGIDPLTLYGTLCVKLEDVGFQPEWLAREIQIVMPRLVVPMGERAVAALEALGHPGAQPLAWRPGEVQRWTPATEAVVVPDIDDSLDAEAAKRAWWNAFRGVGEWHRAQPPF